MPHLSGLTPNRVRAPRTFRAFEDRRFRLLWSANGLSYLCRMMQMTLVALLVLGITNSAWMVALSGFFGMVPTLLFALVGGVLADRVNRARLMAMTQSVSLAASLVLTFALLMGWVNVWHAYVTVFVAGAMWSIDFASRRSFIQDLLGRDGVTNGIALDSVAMHGSRMLGPALAGGLMAWVGVGGGYLVVTAIYIVDLALILQIKAPTSTSTQTTVSPWRNVIEGLQYARGNQVILASVVITVLMNFFFFPYIPMVPVIAKKTLGVGEGLTGILMAADGMGAFLGALVIASITQLKRHGLIFTWGSMFALLLLLAFTFSRWYGLSFPILLLMGFGVSCFATMQSTTVILAAKDEMRGRAMGLISLGIGAGPLGTLVVGAVATAVSPEFAVGLNACVCAVLLMGVWMLMPALRLPIVLSEGSN